MGREFVNALLGTFALSCGCLAQNPDFTNPSAGGAVYSLGIQSDGKMLVGGAFETFNGTPRSCLARRDTDGSLDPNFNPGATGGIGTNAVIYSLAQQLD